MAYRTFAVDTVNSTYRLVFHKDISDSVARFLTNLAYVLSGTLPSIALMSIFNILAARFLGPTEYGRYTLIQSLSAFIGISMIMGYSTAVVKFLPENPDGAERSKTISTAYLLTFVCTLATVGFCLLLAPQISALFHISPEFLLLAAGFAVVYTFYTVTSSTLRGLLRMKLYSLFQVGYAAMVLGGFIVLVASGPLTYESILVPVFVSYGVTGVAVLYLVRKYLAFTFDLAMVSRLTRYSLYCAVGAIAFTLYSNIGQLLIHIRLTPTDLGVYGAYSLAAISVASLLTGAFITVFFPTASQYTDKTPIFNVFAKTLPFLIIVGIPFLACCEIVILWLYGSKYPVYLDLALLFAVTGVCQSVQHLYGWILNSDSGRGVKITTSASIIMAVANTSLNLLLIPALGIRGAVLALMLSYSATFLIMVALKKRYFKTGDAIAGN